MHSSIAKSYPSKHTSKMHVGPGFKITLIENSSEEEGDCEKNKRKQISLEANIQKACVFALPLHVF